jgi:hypothetical protein
MVNPTFDPGPGDGLPSDLETGWVAVETVPVGKRCQAVTFQPPGMACFGVYHLHPLPDWAKHIPT